MKFLPRVLVVVLAIQTCFCVGVHGGDEQEMLEVVLNSVDGVIQHSGDDNQQPTAYRQPILGKEIMRLQSKEDHTQNAPKEASTSPLQAPNFLPERWMDVFDNTWLNEFLIHCEQDAVFKGGIVQNLSAMQAFVAFVSIGYAVVAMWLGPIQLTRWQRRSILITYSAAGLVQAIFLAHSFGLVATRFAYLSTLVLALLFFITFNVTNALLVLQSEAPEPEPESTRPEVQEIIQASSTRVITSLRAPCC